MDIVEQKNAELYDLRAEVERLTQLVKTAFDEGFGFGIGSDASTDEAWEMSDARTALGGE